MLRPEPEFVAAPTVQLPQRELEHRAALAELQQAMGGVPPLEKLATSALLPPELPALPAVPRTEFNASDPTELLSRDAQALLAQSGLAGAVSGLKSVASTAAFFGVEAEGERIVVVVNTSVSVRNKAQRRGVSWARIQEEVTGLVDRLDGGTLFAIVQFSQGVRIFPDSLAPATAPNRQAVRAWVSENLRGNPAIERDAVHFGHEAALVAALGLEPDVIFLVTDGVLDRREMKNGRVIYPEINYATFLSTLRDAQAGSHRRIQIHVIGFEMKPADTAGMERLAGEYGGRVRAF
jgi:hypothetical protein